MTHRCHATHPRSHGCYVTHPIWTHLTPQLQSLGTLLYLGTMTLSHKSLRQSLRFTQGDLPASAPKRARQSCPSLVHRPRLQMAPHIVRPRDVWLLSQGMGPKLHCSSMGTWAHVLAREVRDASPWPVTCLQGHTSPLAETVTLEGLLRMQEAPR